MTSRSSISSPEALTELAAALRKMLSPSRPGNTLEPRQPKTSQENTIAPNPTQA